MQDPRWAAGAGPEITGQIRVVVPGSRLYLGAPDSKAGRVTKTYLPTLARCLGWARPLARSPVPPKGPRTAEKPWKTTNSAEDRRIPRTASLRRGRGLPKNHRKRPTRPRIDGSPGRRPSEGAQDCRKTMENDQLGPIDGSPGRRPSEGAEDCPSPLPPAPPAPGEGPGGDGPDS
jgi:hypothetical protein